MRFSFLVPAYNEEKLMGICLTYLVNNIKGYDAEILVGIDGDDLTEEIARTYAARFKNIKVFKFKKRMGRIGTMNFLIEKATGQIIINHGADLVFSGDLKAIEKAFNDKKVGGLVHFDSLTRDCLNDGQRIFESTYNQIKLKHHCVNNFVNDPVFYCYISRKSALDKPYFKTVNDDTEVTYKLLKNGYKVLYSEKLAYSIIDNPAMNKLTVMDILTRRVRSESFRKEASSILGTERFSTGNRMSEFFEAVLLTPTKTNIPQFFSYLKYISVVIFATILAKIRFILDSNIDAWKYKAKR